MSFNTKSPLMSTYIKLKGILFNNQNIFFNIIFGFIQNQKLVDNLKSALKNYHQNETPFIDDTSKKFYCVVTDCCPLNNFKNFSETDLFNIAYEKKLLKGKIANHSRALKNKIINNTGDRNIPYYWTQQYLYSTQKQNEYCSYIAWILQYYYIFTHNLNYIRNNILDTFNTDYIEYFSLCEDDAKKIKTNLNIDKVTFFAIAQYICEMIVSQCDMQTLSKAEENNECLSSKSNLNVLKKHHDFYEEEIATYGRLSIDRYNLLEKNAKTNVYCARELGSIFYYGQTFYSGNDALKISPDKTKAAYYYQLCKTDNCVHPGGCWALGDMVLKGEFNVPNNDERDYAKKLFKLCGDYAPAQNSIAKIEKSIGDDYFSQYKAIPLDSPTDLAAKIITHYTSAINYAKLAADNNWVYAYNLLYTIITSPVVSTFYNELSKKTSYTTIPPLDLLRKSAHMKNAWAMDKLACELLDNKNRTSNDINEALNLLNEAASQNLSKASAHLQYYKHQLKEYGIRFPS